MTDNDTTRHNGISCTGYEAAGQGLSRRLFLAGALGTAALTTLMPGLALASAPTNKRLVVIIMRGGIDGLATVVPAKDPNYQMLRGNMAFDVDALLPLDKTFGLHPKLEVMHEMYRQEDLAILHAVASPYRKRSHFDAQNVLELGTDTPHSKDSGWLNRAVEAIAPENKKFALSVGFGVPAVLSGGHPVGAWAPSALPDVPHDFYSRMQKIYSKDPALLGALNEGLAFQNKVDGLYHKGMDKKMARQSRSRKGFVNLAEITGKLLADPTGPRIATLEIGGWDTHVNQGVVGGALANNLSLFDEGIKALKENLGGAWKDTVVLALTEFGRTARPNGTRGTDHGTAGISFVMGGAVKGGRVISEWPGLRPQDLYQDRDLKPTIDTREIITDVLNGHYGLSKHNISHNVLPGAKHGIRIGLLK